MYYLTAYWTKPGHNSGFLSGGKVDYATEGQAHLQSRPVHKIFSQNKAPKSCSLISNPVPPSCTLFFFCQFSYPLHLSFLITTNSLFKVIYESSPLQGLVLNCHNSSYCFQEEKIFLKPTEMYLMDYGLFQCGFFSSSHSDRTILSL